MGSLLGFLYLTSTISINFDRRHGLPGHLSGLGFTVFLLKTWVMNCILAGKSGVLQKYRRVQKSPVMKQPRGWAPVGNTEGLERLGRRICVGASPSPCAERSINSCILKKESDQSGLLFFFFFPPLGEGR